MQIFGEDLGLNTVEVKGPLSLMGASLPAWEKVVWVYTSASLRVVGPVPLAQSTTCLHPPELCFLPIYALWKSQILKDKLRDCIAPEVANWVTSGYRYLRWGSRGQQTKLRGDRDKGKLGLQYTWLGTDWVPVHTDRAGRGCVPTVHRAACLEHLALGLVLRGCHLEILKSTLHKGSTFSCCTEA